MHYWVPRALVFVAALTSLSGCRYIAVGPVNDDPYTLEFAANRRLGPDLLLERVVVYEGCLHQRRTPAEIAEGVKIWELVTPEPHEDVAGFEVVWGVVPEGWREVARAEGFGLDTHSPLGPIIVVMYDVTDGELHKSVEDIGCRHEP